MTHGSNAARDVKFGDSWKNFVAHESHAKPANCILVKPISKKGHAALHLESFA